MRIILIPMLLFLCSFAYPRRVIISSAESLKIKQIGDFTCWAATLEAINRYNGFTITQKDLLDLMTISRYKRVLTSEEMAQFRDTQYAALPFQDGIEILGNSNKIIKKNEIELELDKNNPVVFMANNHISIIVGYFGKYYYVMDTAYGKIYPALKTSISFKAKSQDPIFGEALFFSVPKTKNYRAYAVNFSRY